MAFRNDRKLKVRDKAFTAFNSADCHLAHLQARYLQPRRKLILCQFCFGACRLNPLAGDIAFAV